MAQKPETKFRQNRVYPDLQALPNTVIFPIQQAALVGDPDLLLCIQGHFVALELKAEGEEPRPLQQYKLNQVTHVGKGVALVADPTNWGSVYEELKLLAKGTMK